MKILPIHKTSRSPKLTPSFSVWVLNVLVVSERLKKYWDIVHGRNLCVEKRFIK
jgi:hypothetical protein